MKNGIMFMMLFMLTILGVNLSYGGAIYDATGTWDMTIPAQTPYLEGFGYRTVNSVTFTGQIKQDSELTTCDKFIMMTEPFDLYIEPITIQSNLMSAQGTIEQKVYTFSPESLQPEVFQTLVTDPEISTFAIPFLTQTGKDAFLTLYDFEVNGGKGNTRCTSFTSNVSLLVKGAGVSSGVLSIQGTKTSGMILPLNGDYNHNGNVDGDDISSIYGNWGATGLLCGD